MSSSIFIPIEYLYDNETNEFRYCVGHSHVLNNTGDGIYFSQSQTLTYLSRHLERRTVGIDASMCQDKPDIIKGFHFSGFHATCLDIIKFLEMPETTEIH